MERVLESGALRTCTTAACGAVSTDTDEDPLDSPQPEAVQIQIVRRVRVPIRVKVEETTLEMSVALSLKGLSHASELHSSLEESKLAENRRNAAERPDWSMQKLNRLRGAEKSQQEGGGRL